MKLTTTLLVALLFVSGCAGPAKRESRDLPAGEREALAFLEAMQSRLDTPEKQRHWVERMQQADLDVTGVWTRFTPMEGYRPFNQGTHDRLFTQASRDTFDLPEWTEQEAAHLAEMFAPIITQDVAEDYDRFGAVGWHQDRVTIEHIRPVVYYFVRRG